MLSTTGCYFVAAVFDVCMLSRITGVRFDFMGCFLKPVIGSAVMGAAAVGVYRVIFMLYPNNTLATLLAILFAMAVYGAVMLLIKGIREEDLQNVPGGGKMVRVLRR